MQPSERDRDWARSIWGLLHSDDTFEDEDVAKLAESCRAIRAEERREGMEEACKTVCGWCRQQIPLRGHAHDFGDGRLAGCDASAIRSAMEVPTDGAE